MDIKETQTTKSSALRHYGPVMAFAVLCMLIGATLIVMHVKYTPNTSDIPGNTEQTVATTTVQGLSRQLPTRLRIPKIHIDAGFVEPLGLNADKTVSVPKTYDQVGWYKNGAAPGEVGPSVILGHVDNYKGPAVFYSLGQLKEGDEIYVDRADGTTATFVVKELHRYSQDAFPTQEVYGQVPYPALRLVTCTGIFNKAVQKYSQNLVVYAVLKENI